MRLALSLTLARFLQETTQRLRQAAGSALQAVYETEGWLAEARRDKPIQVGDAWLALNRSRWEADLVCVMEFLDRDRPGRSSARRHTELARVWRRRIFGRRAAYYVGLLIVLLVFFLNGLHLSDRWALVAGMMLGMGVMAARLVPEVLLPSHIFNWQLGAWGEQMTATELAKLPRDKWVVRHDLAWGRGNHDHLVAGDAVFVVNSKNVRDSSLAIEGNHLRVRRLDNRDDSYLADRWVPNAASEADYLEHKLRKALGFTVPVYPVVAIWGEFDLEVHHIGKVFVLNGEAVADLIRSRRPDLVKPDKRQQVIDYVRSMPRA